MVDNFDEFTASGQSYVSSLGPAFKFNTTLPMQEPPKLAVDLVGSGITVCIGLILTFTNCTSHRPRNHHTRASLKKVAKIEREEERKNRRRLKAKEKAKKAKRITPGGGGNDTEDSDDEGDMQAGKKNPDVTFAAQAAQKDVEVKLIKEIEVPVVEKELTPIEISKTKIAALKAAKTARDILEFEQNTRTKVLDFHSDERTGNMRLFSPETAKKRVILQPLATKGKPGDVNSESSPVRKRHTYNIHCRGEMVQDLPPPTGVDGNKRQDDDIF
jgi:hypothetical protein